MLVRFYNLGKIKETELDLRPMTVIIGPNNSNKTYIAYSLYGLWQAIPASFSSNMLIMRNFSRGHDNKSVLVKIDETFVTAFQSNCNQEITDFEEELTSFYQDSSGKIFSQTRFQVEVKHHEIINALKHIPKTTAGIFRRQQYEVSLAGDLLTFHLIENQELEQNSVDSGASIRDADFMELAINLEAFLREELFSRPFLLPAERNAFVITYKLLANRRYKLLRESHRQLIGDRSNADAQHQVNLLRESGQVRYPQPVEDFLDFLSDVETARPIPNSPFARLADMIEKNLQDANKTRYRPTALGGQEIVTSVGKGLEIDLYNASSSIKQLAPLLLYLRYRARENDLLIIDEPEMNLHPESQAKLLEILAILVNHGVHVLMTTHSPYLLAHLNNLAQGADGSETARRKQARSLYLKNPEALLRMDQISAYEMKDNQLQSLKDPDYGIQWRTLSDVAVDLQQKYFDLYETGHAQEKPKPARRTAKTAGSKNGQS